MRHPVGKGDRSGIRDGLPFIKVATGSHRSNGQAVGEEFRELVRASVAYYKDVYPRVAGMDFGSARRVVESDYLPYARREAPDLVSELEGVASGAGVPFLDAFVINCNGELTSRPVPESAGDHCTTVAMVTERGCVVAHNEDWWLGDHENLVVLDVTSPSGVRFLAATPPCYLPVTGINSCGIARGANTVRSFDTRPGLPEWFVLRRALEARSLAELERIVCHPRRARGSNNLAGDVSGRLVDIETSATSSAVVESTTWLAHTNHYVIEVMTGCEAAPGFEASHSRLVRAHEILQAEWTRDVDAVQLAAAILRDHAGAPGSICNHPDEHSPFGLEGATMASMIWDLTNGTMHVLKGRPCSGRYVTFTLDGSSSVGA